MAGFIPLNEIIESICSALGRKPPRLSLPVGPTRTLIRLIEKGSHAIGLKPPVTKAIIDKYTEDIAVDGSLIQKELGFVPQYDLKTGWEETIRRNAGKIIEVTPDQLEKLLTRRESATVERKESARQLPRSLFESVCAFLNQDGGTILLGVADDGTVVGVEADAVERLTVEIVNLSNNPQKLNPPFILSPLSVDNQGKHVLVLQVPVSSQIHRCNGIVYDRGHEGDFRVTDPVRIAAMVNRKQNYYTELTVYPYLHVSDFEPGLLDKARRLIRAMTPSILGYP